MAIGTALIRAFSTNARDPSAEDEARGDVCLRIGAYLQRQSF
jgi:hypothetical protein